MPNQLSKWKELSSLNSADVGWKVTSILTQFKIWLVKCNVIQIAMLIHKKIFKNNKNAINDAIVKVMLKKSYIKSECSLVPAFIAHAHVCWGLPLVIIIIYNFPWLPLNTTSTIYTATVM